MRTRREIRVDIESQLNKLRKLHPYESGSNVYWLIVKQIDHHRTYGDHHFCFNLKAALGIGGIQLRCLIDHPDYRILNELKALELELESLDAVLATQEMERKGRCRFIDRNGRYQSTLRGV